MPILVAGLWAATAHAQLALVVSGGATTTEHAEKPNSSFQLPTQSTEVKDSIDEFQRMVKHEQWEKAFKALETVAAKASSGYIDRSDGVLVPSRTLVRGLLASLPTAGKNAYRLFYDSQATALWDKAHGKAEADNLTAIVNNHLISSVGDRAADRLGDLYFEQGDMEQAAATWRSLVLYCPDSKIPAAQTWAKIATALARGGRYSELQDVNATVHQRYAAETVTIGGAKLAARDYLEKLAAAGQTVERPIEQPLPADIALPDEAEPLWQFRYQSKTDPLNPSQPFSLTDVYGRTRQNDFVIPSAFDGKRVYVNLFGVEMAFDQETGKLVWRNGKLHTLQLQQNRQNVMPERYGIVALSDRVWTVGREAQNSNGGGGFTMTAREAATGKEIFSTKKSLNTWNILGPPCPAGDVLYVGASKNNQGRELWVLTLSTADGKLLKSVQLGNNVVDQNQVYSDRIASPTFLVHRDRLYVDTHAGALVSMQPKSGNFDWGILYESPPLQTGYYYYDYQPPQLGISGPIYSAGLLFAKGMRSPRLLGVQTDGPTLSWNRAVSTGAIVVGVDHERLYVAGDELAAYSLKTQELLWATQLPQSARWSEPVITQNRLYQFTARGICEVDKATGAVLKILRGADLDSYGGTLYVTPGAVITVSNLAITAYPLKTPHSSPAN